MNRILPFVFILIAIGLFFGYVRPTWDGPVTTSKTQIAGYDSALQAAERFKENETQLEAARNQIPTDELDRLGAFLPDSVNNVQLILDLNALATNTGVKLSNFTTSEAPNAPTGASGDTEGALQGTGTGSLVDSLTISVNATGTYSAFRAFLAGIEQSLRPLDVTSLTVTDSDTGVYTYALTLKFYWLH